jgi:hypothetical protein
MAYTLNTNAADAPRDNANTDGRSTAQPAVRSSAIEGGTGGGGGGGRTKAASRPFTGAPLIPRAPKPVAPIVIDTPIQSPAVVTPPAVTEQTPKGLPAKVPQPAMPTIPKANRPITVRPERYRSGQGSWEVNAVPEGLGEKPNITPLKFVLGNRPELKPLLRANGVVVQVGEHYLVSPQTYADITDSGNPHYDIVENGRVLQSSMGKTVPVIVVNTSGLEATGSRRDIVNGFAAVKSVDYVYETPTVMGIPEGILEQINYTIDTGTQRPEDSFQIWELNLTGDYSIEKLTTDNAQEDGKLDKVKLEAFTKGVGDRLKILSKDLNIIKSIYYRGELAEADRKQSVKITKRAASDDTEEEILKPERSNYLVKNTEVVGHSATPNSTGTNTTGNSTPPTLPETVTSNTDGVIPPEINTSGLETGKLVNDWNSYGWTPQEKAEIKKTPTNQAPFITIADGTKIGIGAVRFGPTIIAKARIVLPVTSKGGAGQQALFEQYYGTGMDVLQYKRLNEQRIAQLLQLAGKITELETSTSKNY